MPKIRIRELDKTAGSSLYENDNIVFVVDDAADTMPMLLDSNSTLDSYGDTVKQIIKYGGEVIVAKSYKDAESYLKDRNQFNVKFLLAEKNDTSDEEKSDLEYALGIAAYRRDCVVVYSSDKEFTDDEINLFTTLGGDAYLDKETPDNSGKYCLAFYGNNLTKDSTDSLDPALAYILAFLNSVNNGNAEWLAVAGSKRGEIPLDNLSADFLTESDLDNMQPRQATKEGEKLYAINPIVKMNPWGVRIWGNRTALAIDKEGLKASHFANVRILLCDLKKRLYKAARTYQFEQNNDVLWVNFTSSVNTLLEEMKQSYGIAGYKWIKEDTDEKAKLKATLKIIPIEAVEDFDLDIVLTDSLDVEEA